MPKFILIAAITGFLVSTALLAGVTWYANGLRLVLARCVEPSADTHGAFAREISFGVGS